MDIRIKKALDYTENNFAKKISLEEISRISNLSASHFCFLFKAEKQMSLFRYLKQKRMKEARNLLRNIDLSIKQIAYQVGYRDLSNFNHDFKRSFGTTPTKYRKMSALSKLIHTKKTEYEFIETIVRFTNKFIKSTK